MSEGIVPWLNRLSVTVGTELSPETVLVLLVRSTGPIVGEASGGGGDADGLVGDDKVGGKGDGVRVLGPTE